MENFSYIGDLFGKDVMFPVDEDLCFIIGRNGTGKTHVLRKLRDYYKSKSKNVLYYPETRYLDEVNVEKLKSILILKTLLGEDLSFDFDTLNFYEKGQYINNGTIQLLNFANGIVNAGEDVYLLIDNPEINLDYDNKRKLVKFLQSFNNVKKIILVVYQPEIISDNLGCIIHIENIVNIYS